MEGFSPHPDAVAEQWLAMPAPRYTSYPPAPLFHEGVGAGDYARALGALDPRQAVSLYLHIPFCRQLCLFCGCHTSVTCRDDRIARYLHALKSELRLVAAQAPGRLRISHLHFGGGTPNILPGSAIDDLFDTLRSLFDFGDCREIAVELDPRSLGEEHIRAFAANGATRASLGVQDFDPDVQHFVQRIQPREMVEEICGQLHAAGIARVNFDLMYGLPLQTPASVASTARQVAWLKPDRVALFSYAHVPQMKRHQRALEKGGLPAPCERLAMDRAARDVLLEAGYAEISMDHFAKPGDALEMALRAGRLRRNFQGYTDDGAETLVAVGASAIGRMPEGYFQNEHDVRVYETLLRAGDLPVRRGLFVTDEDRLRAAIIEELMCYLECDVAAVCRRHGRAPQIFASAFDALEPYRRDGTIAVDGHRIRLTSPHRMAIRVIARAFDAYAGNPDKTYSRVA